jgi:hypothetical protein
MGRLGSILAPFIVDMVVSSLIIFLIMGKLRFLINLPLPF